MLQVHVTCGIGQSQSASGEPGDVERLPSWVILSLCCSRSRLRSGHQLIDGGGDLPQLAKPGERQVAAELTFADLGQLLADLFKGTQQTTAYPGDDQSKDQQAGEQGKPGTAGWRSTGAGRRTPRALPA